VLITGDLFVNVPPIGQVFAYPDFSEWLLSEPFALGFLQGQKIRFVLDGYADDTHKADYHAALQNLINLNSEALTEVAPFVAEYCAEMLDLYDELDRPNILIETPSDVWKYVQFGSELHVNRRADGDDEDGIYFSFDCNCDWELEHGLNLVLRDGLVFTKVGPYDGHLTNADAYADPTLKGVVFKQFH
jgi:hypothetical protein